MTADDAAARRRRHAQQWLEYADKDIAAARALKDDPQELGGIAAYHCQQAAEKMIKGLLVLAGRRVPKVHNIFYLTDLTAADYPDLVPLMERFGELTGWGVAYRYPPVDEAPAPPEVPMLTDTLAGLDELRRQFAQRIQT